MNANGPSTSKNDLPNPNNSIFEAPAVTKKHTELLKKYFGHDHFKEIQWKIISAILEEKRDVLAIMPTGYGKSLCYQFPAIFTNGITLVISPLISLMEDQVLHLNMANVPSCLLGSAQSKTKQVMNDILEDKFRIIYITPEFVTGEFGSTFVKTINKNLNIVLVAIDEVHCVSQWGNDFRKQYSRLNLIREDLLPNIPILAVTATATPKIQRDILKSVSIPNALVFNTGFDRPNLYFSVFEKSEDVFQDLSRAKLLVKSQSRGNRPKFNGPTIIYAITRAKTEEIASKLSGHGILCDIYHAGMTMKERKLVHEKFAKDEIDVIIATIAFGMGIDKKDVRNVIHYGASGDIAGYYQEVGRAGRDGLPSKCTVFYSQSDFMIHRFIQSKLTSGQFKDHRQKMLNIFKNYLNTFGCRRKFILNYFSGLPLNNTVDDETPKSYCCDNCSRIEVSSVMRKATASKNLQDPFNKLHDFTKETDIFLNAVKTLGGHCGLVKYMLFIRGSKSAKLSSRHMQHPLFGSGKHLSEAYWKAFAELMETSGFVLKILEKNSQYSYLKICLSPNGVRCLEQNGQATVMLQPTLALMKFVQIGPECAPLIYDKPTSSSSSNNSQFSKPSEFTFQKRSTLSHTEVDEGKEERMMLYQKLVKLRSAIALKEKIESYLIASNAELMQMARYKPSTLEELKKCKFDCDAEFRIKERFDQYSACLRGKDESSGATTTASILKALEKHPISSQNLDKSSIFTYELYKEHKGDLKAIAEKRKMNVMTIQNHLLNLLKAGYPVYLRDLNVTKSKLETVRMLREQLVDEDRYNEKDGVTAIKQFRASKSLLPIEVSAALHYIDIRQHLNGLRIQYEDHEQDPTQVTPKPKPDESFSATQVLTKLIDIGKSCTNVPDDRRLETVTDCVDPVTDCVENVTDADLCSLSTTVTYVSDRNKENESQSSDRSSGSTLKRESEEMRRLNLKKLKLEEDFERLYGMHVNSQSSDECPTEKMNISEEDFDGFFEAYPEEELGNASREDNDLLDPPSPFNVAATQDKDKTVDLDETCFDGFFDSSPEEAAPTKSEADKAVEEECDYNSYLLDSPTSRSQSKRNKPTDVLLDNTLLDTDSLDDLPF